MTVSTPTEGSALDALAQMHNQMMKEDEERTLATRRRLAELIRSGNIVVMDEVVEITEEAAKDVSAMNLGRFFVTSTLANGDVISVVTSGEKAWTPSPDGTSADGSSGSPAG